ncbi:Transient receptor potential cation channel subfamily M member [Echinococcus granulosus]|uniref:Transient receptor potential cation channel subfamily M member n=1 Tax=Echinococcus granulosus TaxID=6210 RepID=W6U2J9_ECHGR|nr:Transient receptor potential cation channel subfamily M member [Echinococcus granulosus]EUB55340.1 Transient receptor potential cation channel subfamily M member [Echinococcus granulosus]
MRSTSMHPSKSASSSSRPTWIEEKITQLKCVEYVPSNDSSNRCNCGRLLEEHDPALSRAVRMSSAMCQIESEGERWQIKRHTCEVPTTAFGTVEFQGGPHPTKARYVRLNYETPPETVVQLLLQEWRLPIPSLIISMLGGLANASLRARLGFVVKRGLLRAAKTTDAWVITDGLDTAICWVIALKSQEVTAVNKDLIVKSDIDLSVEDVGTIHFINVIQSVQMIYGSSGVEKVRQSVSAINALGGSVTRLVGEALREEVHVRGSKIVVIGIAPWGAVQERSMLIGKNGTLAGKQETALNPHHNYFLLADNGTSGKFSSSGICLRRRLEQYLAQERIGPRKLDGLKSRVPVVGVLIEGGVQTFRRVFELLTGSIPVPVVICDGSGRAADLLAFMCRHVGPDGDLVPNLRRAMIASIEKTFQLGNDMAESVYSDMNLCMKFCHLIKLNDISADAYHNEIMSVFRMGDGASDEIDLTILTALLQAPGQDLKPLDRLSLTMAWERPDIARSQILVNVNDWSNKILENAMTSALIDDRLEFVQLLLERGLNIYKFLTVRRLVELYNKCTTGMNNFIRLHLKISDCASSVRLATLPCLIARSVGLPDGSEALQSIGGMLEKVIGNGYQHAYRSENPYGFLTEEGRRGTDRACFRYPYTELLQWALLTSHFSLAQFMVLSGEEAIAKALLSVRILRGMRKLMDAEVGTELIKVVYAQEKDFENLAVELQEQCYRQDSAQARRLLTYERCNFSRNTCLSLAYMCESKSFIAHPCAQTILSDLWYGGLREDRFISAKIMLILLGLSMPPLYPLIALCFAPFASNFLEFKTTTSSPSSSRRSSLSSSNIKDDEGTQPQRTTSGPLWRNRFFQDEVGIVENKSHHTVLLDKVSILGKDHNISASSSSLNENGDRSAVPQQQVENTQQSVPPEAENLVSGVEQPPQKHTRVRICRSMDDLGVIAMREEEVQIRHHRPRQLLLNLTQTSQALRYSCPTNLDFATARAAPGNSRLSVISGDSKPPLPPKSQPSETRLALPVAPVPLQSPSEGLNGEARIAAYDTYYPNGGCGDYADVRLKQHQLSWGTKVYKFFSAPVTRYYLHVILYLIFLLLFLRYCLICVPYQSLNAFEAYIYLHILTHAIDQFIRSNLKIRHYAELGVGLLGECQGDFNTSSVVGLSRFRIYSSHLNFNHSFWNGPTDAIATLVSELLQSTLLSIRGLEVASLRPHIDECRTGEDWDELRIEIMNHLFTHSFFSVLGVIVRMVGLQNRIVFLWGRNILVCCCAFWLMKFLEFMKIWRFSGPYIYVIVKMLKAMIPLLSLVILPLVAFGTIREGIMVMNRTHVTAESIKNILLKPYLMLYGEIVAPEIDPTNWDANLEETPLYQMVPVMGAIYLLYSIVLILNVIIAVFNSIYSSVLVQSELVYKYLRYSIIIEYESRPLLPPPFIIISWIYAACRGVYRRCRKHHHRLCFLRCSKRCCHCRRDVRKWCRNICHGWSSSSTSEVHSSGPEDSFDVGQIFAPSAATSSSGHQSDGLKLFLTSVEIEELHDFEEECVEDYWRRKQRSEIKQSELQLENMSVRLAGIQYCLDEVQLRQQDPRGQIHSPEEVLSCLDESQSQKAIVNAPAEKTEPNLQDLRKFSQGGHTRLPPTSRQPASQENGIIKDDVNVSQHLQFYKSLLYPVNSQLDLNTAHHVSRHTDGLGKRGRHPFKTISRFRKVKCCSRIEAAYGSGCIQQPDKHPPTPPCLPSTSSAASPGDVAYAEAERNHLSWRKCGSGRFSANKLKSSTNDLHEGLDAEATTIAKDPLHLAEAVEWAELGGALLRRFHQVSMRTNEERIPLFPKTSATAAVEADGVTTIATTDSAGGTSQTSSATMEGACATRDVLIAAAKALKVATSEELALEVVDPNLNLDYTPLATSPNLPYFLSGSTTAQPASTVRVDSHHAGERALLEKLCLQWHHARHH